MNHSLLEKKIGYSFENKNLLTEALTHSSKGLAYSYERLEFLGDAVLELVVSENLFVENPGFTEGQLTSMRSKLVREDYLSKWALENGLGEFLILGKSEEHSGGRQKRSILCDMVESIIGAMYLDSSFEQAKRFCHDVLFSGNGIKLETDYKSALQELIQKDGKDHHIVYEIVKEEGPPHSRTFYSKVTVDGRELGQGKGSSKKESEKKAAQTALKVLAEVEEC
ncbi:MAG: ribonuclease III [Clostridia bacterium]|nr:ribonuclease III [Clostridia bacterium]